MIISWNTTNACNMFCDHCYRDAGVKADQELNTAEARNLIDEIVQAGFRIMIFSGGEPLLRPDILELVRYARNKGLVPVFGTNGTLITPETANHLKDAGATGMGISLDSMDKEKHDDFRRFPGAWDGAVKGMMNCRNAGLPFQIHTTVMEWNQKEITDITDFAVEIGAKGHHIFFLVPTGRAKNIEEESLKANRYEAVIKTIIHKQREVNIELKPTCAPQFIRIAEEMGLKLRFQKGCLAGTHYCIINPIGDVQPCAYLNIKVGNIRETPFHEIWKNNEVLNQLRTMDYQGNCGGCKFKDKCGGCRARAAYYNDGNYMGEEPWCRYNLKGCG
jgi:putative heme d1 biosynthesis radical SAM protein NirJ2